MPKFYQQSEVYVDVDVDEYLSACSTKETEELVDLLIEDGYLKKDCRPSYDYVYSVSESLFEEALQKLHGKWNSLTKEEEEAIINIAKRF